MSGSDVLKQAVSAFHGVQYEASLKAFSVVINRAENLQQNDSPQWLAQLYTNRAAVYIKLDRLVEALRDANKASQTLHSFVKAHYQSGTIHESLGQTMDAATSYCAALKHIHTLHRSQRQPASAFLLSKLLYLTAQTTPGEEQDYFNQKLSQGLWLSGWDMRELLQMLFHSQDWVSSEVVLQILHTQDKLDDVTLSVLQQEVGPKWEMPVINKENMAQALHSALNHATQTGSLLSLQLLFRHMCRDAGSRDIADAQSNTLLHLATSKTWADISPDQGKTAHSCCGSSQAYLVHWLVLQGLSMDVTNKNGKLPYESVQQGSLPWRYMQKNKNTDFIKDLAYMSKSEVESFLLQRLCTCRDLPAAGLLQYLPSLPAEVATQVQEATDKHRANTAWKALLTGLCLLPHGLVELSLVMENQKKQLVNIIDMVYLCLHMQRVQPVTPDVIAIRQHWPAILETMATDAVLCQLDGLPNVLQQKIQLMQEVNGSEATASFVLHHMVNATLVSELLEKLKEAGHPQLVDTVLTSIKHWKQKETKKDIFFKFLQNCPFPDLVEMSPAEDCSSPSRGRGRRKRNSSRTSRSSTSRCSKKGEKDLCLPEPLKPYEQELASQVKPGSDVVVYLPCDASQVAVVASVIQAHVWYTNDLQEEMRVLPSNGSPRHRKRHASGDDKAYAVLVVVPEWSSVEDVSARLMTYLPHMKVAQHGASSHQKGGIHRQLFTADILVSHTKTVGHCLEAKSLFTSDLSLLICLHVNKVSYKQNLAAFGAALHKGGNKTQKVTVLASLPDLEETADIYHDSEVIDRILSDLNCRRILYVQKHRAALYQEVSPGVTVLSTDEDTEQEILGKALSTVYGSFGYVQGLCITTDDDPCALGEFIETTATRYLPVKPRLINCDAPPVGVKPTHKGCVFWICQNQGTKPDQLPQCLVGLNVIIYKTNLETREFMVLYGEKIKLLVEDVFTFLKLVEYEHGV